MFKFLKMVLYAVIAAIIIFLYWFLPKYAFINKNPGFCVNLTSHIYYCGNQKMLDGMLNITK